MQSRSPDHSPTSREPVRKPTNEAREGVVGHNVRYVLLFGLAGVIVAFAIIYGLFFVR
jgi:hypothetical protein